MSQMKTYLQSHYRRIKRLYFRYERILMPTTLVSGFLVDYFTFTNIDTNTTFTLLFIYWIGAGCTIAFIHLYDNNKIPERLRYVRLFTPLLLQFFFGALLGGSFIFYWFSGAFSVSWPFILLLVILMVSNDLFRDYLTEPRIQIGAYFFVGFSLFSVILPFLFNSLSPLLFVAAGLVSASIVIVYTLLLQRISASVREQNQSIWAAIAAILVVMNVFYFTNVTPPIPLSIREAGVYHKVERINSDYVLHGEKETFLEELIPGQTIHIQPGQQAYVFTAIFAPAEFKAPIVYRWQYYNENQKDWVDRGTFSHDIVGGRNAGYRGYTWVTDPASGQWRVSVETPRGRVLGVVTFTVERVNYPVNLEIQRRD